MKKICGISLDEFFKENPKAFNCETTFQCHLAMFLKEQLRKQDSKVEIECESRIYKDKRSRCDIVVTQANKHYLIELKYVVLQENWNIKGSYGSRRSFIKDLYRLKNEVNLSDCVEKYCIFISNKKAVINSDEHGDDLLNCYNKVICNNGRWEKINKEGWNSSKILVINIDIVSDNKDLDNKDWEEIKIAYQKYKKEQNK